MVVDRAADGRRIAAPEDVHQDAVDFKLPLCQAGLVGVTADARHDAAEVQFLPRLDDPGQMGFLHNDPVQRIVAGDHMVHIPVPDGFHFLQNLCHGVKFLLGKGAAAQLHRQDLIAGTHEVQLIQILRRNFFDRAARVADVFHQPLVFQLPQGFPDRPPADAELFGQVLLHHPGSWGKLPAQYLHAQGGFHVFPQRSIGQLAHKGDSFPAADGRPIWEQL